MASWLCARRRRSRRFRPLSSSRLRTSYWGPGRKGAGLLDSPDASHKGRRGSLKLPPRRNLSCNRDFIISGKCDPVRDASGFFVFRRGPRDPSRAQRDLRAQDPATSHLETLRPSDGSLLRGLLTLPPPSSSPSSPPLILLPFYLFSVRIIEE